MMIKIRKWLTENDFGKTLLHFKNYFSAQIAAKALGVISIPVLTQLLTPESYGIFNVFVSYVAIFAIVMSLNSHASVSRYFLEKDKTDTSFFLGTSVLIASFSFVVTTVCLFVFKEKLAVLLNLPDNTIIYLVALVAAHILLSLFRQVFIPLRKSVLIAKISVFPKYIEFVFAIIFIYILPENKYLGLIYSQLMVSVFVSVYIAYKLTPYIRFYVKKEHVKYILNFSVPLIPYALGGIILEQFDRLMINSYSGSHAAGLYSFAYNIGGLLMMFTASFFQAWMPEFTEYLNDNKLEQIDKGVEKIFRLILSAGFFLIAFGEDIGKILADESFHHSIKIIPIIVIGQIFFAIFRIYGAYFRYYHKTYVLSIVLLTSGVINILLNLWLIPKFGYIAGAYTTVLSYILMDVFTWVSSKILYSHVIVKIRVISSPLLLIFVFICLLYISKNLDLCFEFEIAVRAILFIIFSGLIMIKYLRKSNIRNSFLSF